MPISYSIAPAGVNLDIHDGPIGLSFSGGVDSSILLYYLMREKEDKIYVFTTGNNQRSRYNVKCATTIVEKLIQITGNSNIEHHITYCDVQTKDALLNKLRVYIDNNTINALYTGVTANPPKEVTDTFTLETSETHRTTTKPLVYLDGKFYTPWGNCDKRKIAQMYKEANLLEELYPLTRSCEYDPSNKFFDNIQDPKLGHCGKCWWCEERMWAFERFT